MGEKVIVIGDLLLEMVPEKGAVLSKHTNVVNLLTQKGLVWSLGEERNLDAGPLTILGPFSSYLGKLEIGDEFQAVEDGISFPQKKMIIHFSGANRYMSSYSSRKVKKDIAGRISLLKKMLVEEGKWEGLDFIGESPASLENEGRVIKTLKEFRETGLIRPFKKLLGLGMGLTPTGDDVLTGMVGVMSYMGLGDCNFETMKDKTNPLAWTSIYLANRGRPSFVLKRIIEEIMLGSKKTIIKEAPMLLSQGSTSGTDILYGVVQAADFFTKNP